MEKRVPVDFWFSKIKNDFSTKKFCTRKYYLLRHRRRQIDHTTEADV